MLSPAERAGRPVRANIGAENNITVAPSSPLTCRVPRENERSPVLYKRHARISRPIYYTRTRQYVRGGRAISTTIVARRTSEPRPSGDPDKKIIGPGNRVRYDSSAIRENSPRIKK